MINFIDGIFEKNIKKINDNLTEYVKSFTQYQLFNDNNKNVHENVYHVLIQQLFNFFYIKDLTTEENSGYGRYDFGFPNKNDINENEYILIEIKAYNPKSEKGKNIINKNNYKKTNEKKKITEEEKIKNKLQSECEDAIAQIEEKDYAKKARDNGYQSFIKYG